MVKTKKNFTEGPIFTRLILFTIPIILSGLLQVIYNMADNIVVGSFSGDDLALAAVGCTSSLTTLCVNLLVGLSMGSGVVIAQAYGANDKTRLERSIHTSISFSFIIGIVFAVIAFIIAVPALELMQTKPELMDRAVLYFRIICCGIPASTVYNFGAATLRSIGNSKIPLYILGFSGLLNVVLNLFFVIVCNMAIAGVAVATIISQYASAVAVILILMKTKEEGCTLDPKKMIIDKAILGRIIRFGLPAGLQSSIFSLSNVIITAACNTLPTVAVSAKTIAFNIDGLVYTAMDGYLHATMTFVGQNYGARRFDRVKKTFIYAVVQVGVLGFLFGQLITLFAGNIASLYIDPANPDGPAVIAAAVDLVRFVLMFYFLCGIMNTISGACRGLGNSFAPMIIGIVITVAVRFGWVFIFFPMPQFNSLVGLFYCWPITWVLSITALLITFAFTWRGALRRYEDEKALAAIGTVDALDDGGADESISPDEAIDDAGNGAYEDADEAISLDGASDTNTEDEFTEIYE